MKKWVFKFNEINNIDKKNVKNLLGTKGANLVEMTSIGLPVPPGFVISTEACLSYYKNGQNISEEIKQQVYDSLKEIEAQLSLSFGNNDAPLLLSVRSGARVSMPGMMDTILNVGLNDVTVETLARSSTNRRFAYDSYRRLIQMYSDVVLGIEQSHFEYLLDVKKRSIDVKFDQQLNTEHLISLIADYKKFIKSCGKEFPQDVFVQLWGSIDAVFKSWENERAKKYRQINNIPDNIGTAVNVQSMVFGNLNDNSATGVCFTRDPSTGERIFGEYLINAQGEDVVSGVRTPVFISNDNASFSSSSDSMELKMPQVYKELRNICEKLEKHFKDMQDVEFTIENGKLWMLQTRSGKRGAKAAIKIAVDMAKEGLITKEEGILRINQDILDQLLHPVLASKINNEKITRGLPASPGAACGKIVFSSKEAEVAALNDDVLLVRNETSPEDISGMNVAKGILTVRGGMTSHAAVVARGMGKPCITGAMDMHIDMKSCVIKVGNKIIREGEIITINGTTGDVYLGEVETTTPEQSAEFKELMSWVDSYKKLNVRANADTPKDAYNARCFGAEGIGLCRTEHMFFKPERLLLVRKMILARNKEERKIELDKLLEFQREDFIGIFKVMDELPVTIRLLDPPLHEFLPMKEQEIEEFSEQSSISVQNIKEMVSSLIEVNPMLGHRGCRLGIIFPEIYKMQVRAIFEAKIQAKTKGDLEIMVPLITGKKELEIIKKQVEEVALKITEDDGKTIEYSFGTMIELPSAALRADEIAESAEFFSFGTNDLTQTTLGISRDDSVRFLKHYVEAKIFEKDPFMSLDEKSVGELIKIACERGKKQRTNLKIGICGEHGGDPASIKFFHKSGFNYVSCSPYRVPVAKLAAAQAAILEGMIE